MKFFKNINDTSLHLIFLGVIAVVAIASLSWLSLSLGQTDELLSVGQAAVASARNRVLVEYTFCINDCKVLNAQIETQNNLILKNKKSCLNKDCPDLNDLIKQKIIDCEKESQKIARNCRIDCIKQKFKGKDLNNCQKKCSENNPAKDCANKNKKQDCNKKCSEENKLITLENCEDKCTRKKIMLPLPAQKEAVKFIEPVQIPQAIVPVQEQVLPVEVVQTEPEQISVPPQILPAAQTIPVIQAIPATQLSLQITQGVKNSYVAVELIDLKISATAPNGNPAKLIDGWNVAYGFWKYDSVYDSYVPYSESALPQAGNLEFNSRDNLWHTLNLLAAQPIGRYNLFAPQVIGKYKLQVTLYCANTQKCPADTQVQKDVLFEVLCTTDAQCGAGKHCDLGICKSNPPPVVAPLQPAVPLQTADRIGCRLLNEAECIIWLKGGSVDGLSGCPALLVTQSMSANCEQGSSSYASCVCRKLSYPYLLSI